MLSLVGTRGPGLDETRDGARTGCSARGEGPTGGDGQTRTGASLDSRHTDVGMDTSIGAVKTRQEDSSMATDTPVSEPAVNVKGPANKPGPTKVEKAPTVEKKDENKAPVIETVKAPVVEKKDDKPGLKRTEAGLFVLSKDIENSAADGRRKAWHCAPKFIKGTMYRIIEEPQKDSNGNIKKDSAGQYLVTFKVAPEGSDINEYLPCQKWGALVRALEKPAVNVANSVRNYNGAHILAALVETGNITVDDIENVKTMTEYFFDDETGDETAPAFLKAHGF